MAESTSAYPNRPKVKVEFSAERHHQILTKGNPETCWFQEDSLSKLSSVRYRHQHWVSNAHSRLQFSHLFHYREHVNHKLGSIIFFWRKISLLIPLIIYAKHYKVSTRHHKIRDDQHYPTNPALNTLRCSTVSINLSPFTHSCSLAESTLNCGLCFTCLALTVRSSSASEADPQVLQKEEIEAEHFSEC